jgi:hypothetical protein
MSSIAPLPTLSALQASFSAGLAGLSSEAADEALMNLRQVPAFSGFSALTDLASQDAVARLVFKPSLFQEGAARLKAFGDLNDLRALSLLPSIKERLKASAGLLDLRRGVQIYGAMLVFNDRPDELEVVRRTMSRALGDRLNWPQNLTEGTLGDFAVSVRKAFDAYEDSLSAEQRHDLMQIAARLNESSAALCAFDAAEVVSPIQARKLSALIGVLYGAGFGDDRCETLSEGLRRLAHKWGKLDATKREEVLRASAALARDLLEEVESSYAALFDPIGATPDLRLTGATASLARHLASLT